MNKIGQSLLLKLGRRAGTEYRHTEGVPPIVICAGLHGSASTWMFNVATHLIRRASPASRVVSAFFDSLAVGSLPDGNWDCAVLKSHTIPAPLQLLERLSGARVLLSVRDPRDAVVSVMARFDCNCDAALWHMSATLPELMRLATRSDILVLRYEDGFADTPATLDRMAAHLRLSVRQADLREVFAAHTPQAVVETIAELASKGVFDKAPPDRPWHEETLWYPGHVGDRRSGKWRDVLTAAEVERVSEATRSFCLTFGYEVDDLAVSQAAGAQSAREEAPPLAENDLGQDQVRACLSLLTPMKVVGGTKVKVGGSKDSGFVMLEDFPPTPVCYALGGGTDVSWGVAMATQWDALVHHYDHRVGPPPTDHPQCHFHSIGIGGHNYDPSKRRLDTIITEHGNDARTDMILKCDIEGAEWTVLGCLSAGYFARFDQIVLELHWLDHLCTQPFRDKWEALIGNISRTHQCFHIHGNNFASFVTTEGVPVPEVVTVSFARRLNRQFADNDEMSPGALDVKNRPDAPDMFLGFFRF